MDVNLSVRFEVPEFEFTTDYDPHKLSQVIRNLISNGLKFCKKPGIVSVEVDIVSAIAVCDKIHIKNSASSSQKENRMKCLQQLMNLVTMKTSVSNNIATGNENKEVEIKYLRLSVKDDGAGISKVILTVTHNKLIRYKAAKTKLVLVT